MNSESSDELSKLAGEAAAADAGAQPEVAPEMPSGQEFVPAPSAGDLEEARRTAALIMGGIEKLTARRFSVGLSPETKEQGAEKLAPLLVKYDLDSPFISKWRAEIDAGLFFGGLVYGIYEAVQSNKAEERKTAEGGGDGGE